ncbi:MAG: ParB/RepB/Spo0J family partition protein [Chlorobi bacterium]|nr:ParB/RepB/Spo0J family partition protein [Chlorobiota bacterium]
MARKNALGKGLGALIEDAGDLGKNAKASAAIIEVDISDIEANPWQPRTTFDEEKLAELAKSIKEIGIIQPLTLRKTKHGKYQLIAGERRFRASKLAGLDKVPAYVRIADDDSMLEMALVENIQREDLDPIEIAISYQRLIDECKLTQESMSERVGKKRSTISNYLRLLRLPAEIQLGLRNKQISMGHARALVNIEDANVQIQLYERIVAEDMSVRKVEQEVKGLNTKDKDKKGEEKKTDTSSEDYTALEKQLSELFSTNIRFSRSKSGKGKIVIPFGSDDELEKIINILDKAK